MSVTLTIRIDHDADVRVYRQERGASTPANVNVNELDGELVDDQDNEEFADELHDVDPRPGFAAVGRRGGDPMRPVGRLPVDVPLDMFEGRTEIIVRRRQHDNVIGAGELLATAVLIPDEQEPGANVWRTYATVAAGPVLYNNRDEVLARMRSIWRSPDVRVFTEGGTL